jgi:hypothetical protein
MHSCFEHRVWTTSYEMGFFDLTKILPANDMEEPRGFDCPMRAFVDADHATDSSAMTRKSRTGLLIYLNNMPT